MDMLFLRLPHQTGGVLQAVSCIQGHWQRLASWRTLDDMGAWLRDHKQIPVILLTPVGLDIALTLQATPKQRREAGVGLVSLAEESLAEDYDKLHWVLDSLDEERVLARGIRLEWLQQWLDLLKARGLQVKAAIPEAALLNADRDSWVWLPSGNEVFIQTEPGQAALVSPDDAAVLLEQLLQQRPLKTPVRLRHPQGAVLPALPDGLQPSPAPWQDWADLLKTQSPALWLRHAQNWLTGALQPGSQQTWSPLWKPALALLAGAILLQVGIDRYEAHRFKVQAEAARAEAGQLYRQWFPGERVRGDLEQAFKQRLASAGVMGPEQVLQLLAQTAPTPQWQVQRLEFRDGGKATAEVLGSSLGEAQAWVGNLGALGLQASLENARLEAGQARAKIILTPARGK